MTQETFTQVERKQVQNWLRTLTNCRSNLFLKDDVEHIDKAMSEIKEALAQDVPETNFGNMAQPEPLEGLKLIHKADIDLAKKRALEHLPAAQPEQEPVEWGVDWGKDGNSVSIIKRLADGSIEVLGWEYAPHPPQRTEQEQQIETLKRCLFQMQEAAKDLVEQAKSLPPPQRTWVGLTTDDWDEIRKQVKFNFEMTTGEYAERVSHLVEAKLKEKNT